MKRRESLPLYTMLHEPPMTEAQLAKRKPPRPLPVYAPGQPVVLWSDSTKPRCSKEYGRVIDSWWNAKLGCWDYYVAFFGNRWPTKRKPLAEKPYVLRYLETSLKPYEPT